MGMLRLRVLAFHIVLHLWSWSATLAGSACSRHWQLNSGLATTSRSRRDSSAGMGSEVCHADTSYHKHSRSLWSVLHGDIVGISNWTCSGHCDPVHENETVPVDDEPDINQCVESRQIGSLQLQDDIDLQCMGYNITCEDLQNETWKNYKHTLFENCNQDEDLLVGECEMTCRLKRYPTKRCTYQFDRKDKYGMHGKSGMYGFHHCVLYKICNNKTLLEENYLYCNITDSHEILFSSSVTTSVTPTTTSTTLGPKSEQVELKTTIKSEVKVGDTELPTALSKQELVASGWKIGDEVVLAQGTAREEANVIAGFGSIILKYPLKYDHTGGVTITRTVTLIVRVPAPAKKEDDSDYGVLFGVIGALSVSLLVVVAALFYFKVCPRRKQQAPSNNTFAGVVREDNEGSTVVVGRPIDGLGDAAGGKNGQEEEDPKNKV